MKTSESSESWYLGRPLAVFLVILGGERVHPKPNGPFPLPELYVNERLGCKPPLVGLQKIGKDNDAVPVAGLTSNFSPIPPIEPPPWGSEIEGTMEADGVSSLWLEFDCVEEKGAPEVVPLC
jgi:hypothetical protein